MPGADRSTARLNARVGGADVRREQDPVLLAGPAPALRLALHVAPALRLVPALRLAPPPEPAPRGTSHALEPPHCVGTSHAVEPAPPLEPTPRIQTCNSPVSRPNCPSMPGADRHTARLSARRATLEASQAPPHDEDQESDPGCGRNIGACRTRTAPARYNVAVRRRRAGGGVVYLGVREPAGSPRASTAGGGPERGRHRHRGGDRRCPPRGAIWHRGHPGGMARRRPRLAGPAGRRSHRPRGANRRVRAPLTLPRGRGSLTAAAAPGAAASRRPRQLHGSCGPGLSAATQERQAMRAC